MLIPGVQDAEEPNLSTEMFGVLRDLLEGLCRRGEEDVEHDLLVTKRNGIQGIGDREGDVPVWDRKKMGESFLQPLCFLETLTLRAVTVPTRVVRDANGLAAIAARVDVSTKGGGATLLDVSHDFDLGRGRRMVTAILLAVRTQDVRDLETRS